MKRIYISGPITGTTDYLERFDQAEEDLKEEFGDKVVIFNPARVNNGMPEQATYEQYMTISFALMDMCDAIYLLNGWEDSKGCNREYGYALGKDMIILFEQPIGRKAGMIDEKILLPNLQKI